jgi:Mce-associated membrane protein
MRSRKRPPPAPNGDQVGESPKEVESAAADALTLAEEAEAEAAEAEAAAAAARARTRAIRLRREVEAAKAAPADEAAEADDEDDQDGKSGAVFEGVAEEPAARRRRLRLRRPRLKVVAAAAAILAICALLAASGYMTWYIRQSQADERLDAEFSAAARQNVVTLMSLDYNNANEDVQRIIDSATGQFKQDFEAQRDNFVQVAVESKAVTETNVTATGVEEVTDDTAVVLVAAASRVTNAAGAKQEPRTWRLSVNLAREGGQIKMSKVEFVP